MRSLVVRKGPGPSRGPGWGPGLRDFGYAPVVRKLCASYAPELAISREYLKKLRKQALRSCTRAGVSGYARDAAREKT